MKSSPDSNEFRDYLLGRLSPEAAEAIEERLFQDEACFSDLQDAEDELIEEFVTGEMDPAEAQLFGTRLERDPHLQERIAIRRALIRAMQSGAAETVAVPATAARAQHGMWSRFLVPGFAVAIAILFFISYKAVHRNALPPPATGSNAAPAPAGNRQEAMTQAAVLFLPAHGSRGAAQQPSVLHVGSAAVVRLELETPSAKAWARWDVRISNANGKVFSADGLTPRQAGVVSYVVAEVGASRLPPGMYRVTLSPESSSNGAVSTAWDLEAVQ
jgi:anti-sigma factor RsiW